MTDIFTARHKITGIVADYPKNIIEHEVLGQYLEVLVPEADGSFVVEDEDDKVVIDKKIFPRKNTKDQESDVAEDSIDQGVK